MDPAVTVSKSKAKATSTASMGGQSIVCRRTDNLCFVVSKTSLSHELLARYLAVGVQWLHPPFSWKFAIGVHWLHPSFSRVISLGSGNS